MFIFYVLMKACTGVADFIDTFRETEDQNDDDQQTTNDEED